MNNKVKAGVFVLILAACARFFGVDQALIDELTGPTEETTEQEVAQEEELGRLDNYLPTTNLGDTLSYGEYFTVSYSESHRQAEWVAYEISKENLEKESFRRPPSFKPDDRVDEDYRVGHRDYSSTNFDRGHLASAADFSWGREAIETTFYTTNISPQEPRFNRGIWKHLESAVRGWAMQYEHVYVVTGPILTERAKKRLPKDKNYVAVPRRYYKVVLNYTDDNPIAIGFIMKNEDSKSHLSNYVVPIDEIENITGIDFFSEMPDELEDKVEAGIDLDAWGLNVMSRSVGEIQFEYDTSEVQ
ncbi:MAG: DNA/RNA non-specific endonuclease [Saprospiraceae bacterium]